MRRVLGALEVQRGAQETGEGSEVEEDIVVSCGGV